MKILVTGAQGFIGKNLCAALENIRDGFDRRPQYESLRGLDLVQATRDTTADTFKASVADADFIFHLAGVNRADEDEAFVEGNFRLTQELMKALEDAGNNCPVVFASSAQANPQLRRGNPAYGESKLAAEEAVFAHGEKTGASVYVYRFPNVFGKWCRPNYNSVVATFCHNLSHGLPIRIDDPKTELELLYIDDLVAEFLRALLDKPTMLPSGFCQAGPTYRITLGELAEKLSSIEDTRKTIRTVATPVDSFDIKLASTYESFLDPEDAFMVPTANIDERGLFAELFRFPEGGQVSLVKVAPGYVRGKHWHNTKWERFCAVSGKGRILTRKHGLDHQGMPYPVFERSVEGNNVQVVDMLPGYVHEIVNDSADEELVLVVWASEQFDPANPDTYFEEV